MNKKSKIRIVHLFMPGLAAPFRTAKTASICCCLLRSSALQPWWRLAELNADPVQYV